MKMKLPPRGTKITDLICKKCGKKFTEIDADKCEEKDCPQRIKAKKDGK